MEAPGLFAGHQNRFAGFQAIINFQLIEQWLNRNFTAADPGIKTCQHTLANIRILSNHVFLRRELHTQPF